MPGPMFSNELIVWDEALHCERAHLIDSICRKKTGCWMKKKIHPIIPYAVNCVRSFVITSLLVRLVGMNLQLLIEY